MAYEVARVNEQVCVFARWDEVWNSFNNCYVVSMEGQHVLVDCGKAEHSTELVVALGKVGLHPDDITSVLATHGHWDHFGAYTLCSKADMYIHPADRGLLTKEAQLRFNHDLPDDGGVMDFACVLLGHHSAGSVALFHRPSGTLFAGDHLCFFGAQLPPAGLVSAGPELRERAQNFVSGWAQDHESRSKNRFEDFLHGINVLSRFPARTFCTGHGGVLVGSIPEFLQELATLGSKS